MPKTRWIVEEDGQGNIIDKVPYEVSDEQLDNEQTDATCEQYLANSPPLIPMPQIVYLLRAYGQKLGLKFD